MRVVRLPSGPPSLDCGSGARLAQAPRLALGRALAPLRAHAAPRRLLLLLRRGRFAFMDAPVAIPLYLDLAAVFLGGLAGSLHAVRRGFAITGVVALAVAAGLGGGILRDLLLQQGPPVALTRPAYLPTAFVAAVVGFFFGSLVSRFRKPILLMDAVWLGLYAVVGSEKALAAGLSGLSAILVGVVTATGGSVLMDVLAGETPELVRPGPIGHFGAIIGAVIYVSLVKWLDVPALVGMFVTVGLVFVIRIAALQFGIQAPTPLDIPRTLSRAVARPRSRKRGPVGSGPAGFAAASMPTAVVESPAGDQPPTGVEPPGSSPSS